jgi:hypothetical protein
MLFDLTFPCYLTLFIGKKCLSGKVICAFFVPLIEIIQYFQIYAPAHLNLLTNNHLGYSISVLRVYIPYIR